MMRAKRFWTWLKGERAKPLRDIGGIVLGVLIALGIGEIADDIRWRFKVADTEAAMRAELGSLRRALSERISANDCIERRLDAIGAILDDARHGKPVPPLINYARPPTRLLESTAFEVAREEGVSLHMSREKWRMYAAAYGLITGFYGSFADPERARWDTLKLLENMRGSTDPNLLASLSISWVEAKAYARRQANLAKQGDTVLAGLGIDIDWTFDAAADDPHSVAEQAAMYRDKSPMCKPLTAG